MGEGLEVVDQCVLEAALIIERVGLDHSDLRVGRAVVSPDQGFSRFERFSAIKLFISNPKQKRMTDQSHLYLLQRRRHLLSMMRHGVLSGWNLVPFCTKLRAF